MQQEILLKNQNNSKRILVTGATGLVGNELVKQLLEKNEKVTAIYHSTPITISHPNLEAIPCDILDVERLSEIMESITNVYHCAAFVSYHPDDRKKILKINIEGTANIVNACIDSDVKKLVHVSSVGALGRIREGEVVTESMNWTEETSNSIYGKSKYLGELEVWRGIGEGLEAVIVNPALILGGSNWNTGSTAIFKKAYDEFPWFTVGVSGFVDVRDVANAMILLMNSDIKNQRFILNGENLSFKEIFTSIATCFGKKPPHKKVTPFLAELIWRLETIKTKITGKKNLLTKESVRTAMTKVYYDNSKILKALPQFQFIRIKDTIEYTCEALKEKYHL